MVVSFDPDRNDLLLADDEDATPYRFPLRVRDEAIVDDGVFIWPGGEVVPDDDDFGTAVAAAHLITAHMAFDVNERRLVAPVPGAQRWQYAVVNTGSFNSMKRLSGVLALAGSAGWELISVYDKASNWIGGTEKGFMLLKRAVPDDFEPEEWCVAFRNT